MAPVQSYFSSYEFKKYHNIFVLLSKNQIWYLKQEVI